MFFTKRLQTNTMLQRFIGLRAEKSKKIKKSWISRAKRDNFYGITLSMVTWGRRESSPGLVPGNPSGTAMPRRE